MRFLAPTLSIIGTAALVACVSAADGGANTISESSIIPGAYIVEVETDQDPTALYQELELEGISVDARRDLQFRLFRGGSFQLRNTSSSAAENDAQAQRVLQKSNVKNVWPVRAIQFPKPTLVSVRNGSAAGDGGMARRDSHRRQSGDNDTYAPHVITQVDQLHAAGFTGKGVKIGIVDTGVDYTHPALGGCFGPGCVVSYGYDLTGDNYWAGLAPVPDSDPYDNCQGHGTHVAGIVAAQSIEATRRLGFAGAAPDVTLGMYKISGCPGYTTSEMLLAGFNMAYEDGSDVISCSAGDDSGWAGDAAAVMAARIVDAGVPVVVALGNSGALGLWQAASPASGEGVTAAGSVDSPLLPTLVNAASYSIGNGTAGTLAWQDGAPEFANVTLPVLFLDSTNLTRTDAACDPLPTDTPDLSTSLVLLGLSTTCSSNQQVKNLVDIGAKNVMFYSLTTGSAGFNSLRITFNLDVGLSGVGLITLDQAQTLAEARNKNKTVTVAITNAAYAEPAAINFPNTLSGGHVSTFSSWGPTWETLLKPQIAAPGGNILSTYIDGAYAVMSGTSMATPLAAAVIALVIQARGTHDPTTINSVVAATAQRTTWYNGTAVDDTRVAPAAQQGGGLVQAYAAARTPVLLSVTSLSFNDSDHFPGPQTFRVSHVGPSMDSVDLVLGHVPAITMNTLKDNGDGTTSRSQFPNPIVNDAAATLSFDVPGGNLTVPPGGSVDITVTLTPPPGVNATLLPVYSGYITLEGAAVNLSLPYVGVAGSFAATPAVQRGYAAGCYLTTTEGHFNIPAPSNQTFTIPGPGSNSTSSTIYPRIIVRPTMGTPLLRLDVVSASGTSSNSTTDFMGVPSLGMLPGMPVEFVAGLGFAIYVNGTLNDGTVVPAGAYKVVVSAVKIFGDKNKEKDWTMVETVPFVIAYK
ncbi:minor extracellular protease vpr [Ophiostoma piceae UAMH 11346]|uniref:Minor extracellular protease vpr n=1 Tax=Ophiostoma piceae (strain UAMH 11346) TaxID=1262450 RepID=S3CQ39_OPHP1|nr:minor extracellular protease vpr [Ophiostoma piceae UAMH 11346]